MQFSGETSARLTQFWIANIVAAFLFGALHLPATAAITSFTPLIVVRALVLNGIAGLLFGWFFWEYGLAAAMTAHAMFDIMLHIVMAELIKSSSTTQPVTIT